jgi:hypothetical protein
MLPAALHGRFVMHVHLRLFKHFELMRRHMHHDERAGEESRMTALHVIILLSMGTPHRSH